MEDVVGVRMFGKVQEFVEGPRLLANDMVVDIPVPMVQTVLKTVEAQWLPFINVVGEIRVVVQR